MKAFALFTAFCLATGSAFAASSTVFPYADAHVIARVDILQNEADPRGFLPGSPFEAVLSIENHSLQAATVLIPHVAFRWVAFGSHVQTEPWTIPDRIVVGPRRAWVVVVQGFLPYEAQVSSCFRVGMVVALASNVDDMRAIFAMAAVVANQYREVPQVIRPKKEAGGIETNVVEKIAPPPRRRR